MGLTSVFSKREYELNIENISIKVLINNEIATQSTLPLFTLHSHYYAEIFVCLSGEMQIQTTEKTIHLFKDDVFIVPINIPHRKLDTNSDCLWYSIGVTITPKKETYNFNLYKKLQPIYENSETMIFSNQPQLCKTVQNLDNNSHLTDCNILVMEFICHLTKLATLNNNYNPSGKKTQKSSTNIKHIARIEDIIETFYYEPLTTNQLADTLHISSRHLCRIIKSRYGLTFHQVLVEKRLENAAKLLTTTNETINKIYTTVGYTKNSSFYKDFQAKFGMSPNEYRNDCLKSKSNFDNITKIN